VVFPANRYRLKYSTTTSQENKKDYGASSLDTDIKFPSRERGFEYRKGNGIMSAD
jgi:hypothetical protein